MIENTVLEEMEKGVFFKEIYSKCKSKVNTFVSLMYLDTDVKKLNPAVQGLLPYCREALFRLKIR